MEQENQKTHSEIKSIVIALLGLFLLVLSINYGIDAYKIYESLGAGRQTITMSAEGRVIATPDIASFNITVITESKDPKAAENENTSKTNAIIDFLKSKGIDKKDIKTSNYNLAPQYYYPYDYPRIPCPLSSLSCPPKIPVIIGYELNQIISVKIRDFKIIGDVLEGSIAKGANSLSDLQFSIEDPDNLKNEARKIAIEKAKEKAKDLTKIADVKLGKVVSFSEELVSFPQITYGKAMESRDLAPAPQIEAGSQEIVMRMSVIFEIK